MLSWALLIDAFGWNFWLNKAPHHDKVSFIKGVEFFLFAVYPNRQQNQIESISLETFDKFV